jgi:hypothetical protein
MNREQWQQKRVHAGAKRASTAPDAAEIARRVQATTQAADTTAKTPPAPPKAPAGPRRS